jgi:hypothetical protein
MVNRGYFYESLVFTPGEAGERNIGKLILLFFVGIIRVSLLRISNTGEEILNDCWRNCSWATAWMGTSEKIG